MTSHAREPAAQALRGLAAQQAAVRDLVQAAMASPVQEALRGLAAQQAAVRDLVPMAVDRSPEPWQHQTPAAPDRTAREELERAAQLLVALIAVIWIPWLLAHQETRPLVLPTLVLFDLALKLAIWFRGSR